MSNEDVKWEDLSDPTCVSYAALQQVSSGGESGAAAMGTGLFERMMRGEKQPGGGGGGDAPLFALSSEGGPAKRYAFKPINMERLTRIYSWAEFGSIAFDRCQRMLEDAVFDGGFDVEFVGNDVTRRLQRLTRLATRLSNIDDDGGEAAPRRRRRRKRAAAGPDQPDAKTLQDVPTVRGVARAQPLANGGGGSKKDAAAAADAYAIDDGQSDVDETAETIDDTRPVPVAPARANEPRDVSDDDDDDDGGGSEDGGGGGGSALDTATPGVVECFRMEEHEADAITALARKAMRYRRVLGFVPITYTMHNGAKMVSIPEFGTVSFAVALDRLTNETWVVALETEFERQLRGGDKKRDLAEAAAAGGKQAPSLRLSRLTRVYTFSNGAPTLDGSVVHTRVPKLWHEAMVLREHEALNMRAHRLAAYPPFVVAPPPPTPPPPLEEMTEQQLVADAGALTSLLGGHGDLGAAMGNAPRESWTYRRHAENQYLDAIAMRRQAERAGANAGNFSGADPLLDGAASATMSPAAISTPLVPPHLGNRVDLPEGARLQHAATPTVFFRDTELMRDRLDRHICEALGVPYGVMRSETLRIGGGASAAADALGDAVASEREDVAAFVKYIYEELFRERDTAWMISLLGSIRQIFDELDGGGGGGDTDPDPAADTSATAAPSTLIDQREIRTAQEAAAATAAPTPAAAAAGSSSRRRRRRPTERERVAEQLRAEAENVRQVIVSQFRARVIWRVRNSHVQMGVSDAERLYHSGAITLREMVNLMRTQFGLQPVGAQSQLLADAQERADAIAEAALQKAGGAPSKAKAPSEQQQ